MRPLCVVILTFNEGANVGKALASIGDHAQAVVLDSRSKDDTAEIARNSGAEVHLLDLHDRASLWNYAIESIRDRFEWVFLLEADEEIGESLWREIERTCGRNDVDGAHLGLVRIVLDRELRHRMPGSSRALRLVRTRSARVVPGIHARLDDRGVRTTRLVAKLVQHDRKPLAAWFRSRVRYAEREAEAYVAELEASSRRRESSPGVPAALRPPVGATLPAFVRPSLRFWQAVVLHGAWRDGAAGLLFAGMQAFWYPMLVELLVIDCRLRRNASGNPDPRP